MEKKIKTLFLGTDWESLATLETLYKDTRFEIIGVITASDKPVGRKQILTPSKVKSFALENNIPVFHTERNQKKYREALEIFKPELIVCKAFGEIVPEFFIEYPKYKAINIHFSILPKYRGAVPIQKAILDGEKETGISIMLMSKGLDEGDVLKVFKEKISTHDTNLSLRERLVKLSSEVICNVLYDWVSGKISPIKQEDSLATYCWQKDISKESAEIKWDKYDAEYIERMVRAFVPWPVAWCKYNGKIMKIYEAEAKNIKHNKNTGELFAQEGELLFSTKDRNKAVLIHELQLEGKNKITGKDFVNGNKLPVLTSS